MPPLNSTAEALYSAANLDTEEVMQHMELEGMERGAQADKAALVVGEGEDGCT